jgi:hypothetical protein
MHHGRNLDLVAVNSENQHVGEDLEATFSQISSEAAVDFGVQADSILGARKACRNRDPSPAS